jgi:hypothetical protein
VFEIVVSEIDREVTRVPAGVETLDVFEGLIEELDLVVRKKFAENSPAQGGDFTRFFGVDGVEHGTGIGVG